MSTDELLAFIEDARTWAVRAEVLRQLEGGAWDSILEQWVPVDDEL
jgi:hypothetical protein